MEKCGASETLITIYQQTCDNIPEDLKSSRQRFVDRQLALPYTSCCDHWTTHFTLHLCPTFRVSYANVMWSVHRYAILAIKQYIWTGSRLEMIAGFVVASNHANWPPGFLFQTWHFARGACPNCTRDAATPLPDTLRTTHRQYFAKTAPIERRAPSYPSTPRICTSSETTLPKETFPKTIFRLSSEASWLMTCGNLVTIILRCL